MKIIQYDKTNVHLLPELRMNFRILIDDKLYRYSAAINKLDYSGLLTSFCHIVEVKEFKDE